LKGFNKLTQIAQKGKIVANFEQRDNSGSVFVNNRKEKDTHPDRTGRCMIDGKMYWISGWIKQKPSDGEHWMSLAFKAMDAEQSAKYGGGATQAAPQWKEGAASSDAEVPF
jgi:hypothetical protein